MRPSTRRTVSSIDRDHPEAGGFFLRRPTQRAGSRNLATMASLDRTSTNDGPPSEPGQTRADEMLAAPAHVPPAIRVRPTPHLNKLKELLTNDKLEEVDRGRVQAALEHYEQWISGMSRADGEGDEKVSQLVARLNDYKRFIELDVIWDSVGSFLFRNRGQTKLDNSIIEEFLPWLVDPAIINGLAEHELLAGPHKAFAAASFGSTILSPGMGGELRVRTKDQDFTIGRRAYLRSSFSSEFVPSETSHHEIHLAYIAAECKTNLDKTMFQEANATANDLRIALPGSRYFLIAEYLDMRPISTAGSDIEEVLILRGRRMGAEMRKHNAKAEHRQGSRDQYVAWLDKNPIREDIVLRFVGHLRSFFSAETLPDEDVIERGYF